jgi:two-component system phosphate regulon sensor histidine kinase PhoR
MHRPRLFWRIYLTYLIVVLLCTAAVGILAVTSTRSFYLDHTESELKARAALVGEQARALLEDGASGRLEELVMRLGGASGTRITVIAGRGMSGASPGQVLAETTMMPAGMESHRDRPEFQAAMRGGTGTTVRFSHTLDEDMMYVAVPVKQSDGQVAAVIRVAIPLNTLDHALASLNWRVGLAALGVAVGAAMIGLFVSSRISRQMREVKEGATAFAAGDFSHKLAVPRTAEFASVAESLNAMAEELDEKIRTVTRERNESEAVLVSMIEGVLAVDTEERNHHAQRSGPHGCSGRLGKRPSATASRRSCAIRSCSAWSLPHWPATAPWRPR